MAKPAPFWDAGFFVIGTIEHQKTLCSALNYRLVI